MIVPTVTVSDHALVRYLERVKGIDIEAACAEVAEIAGVAAALGATCKVHAGHCYVIAGYTVTTVLPEGGRLSRKSRPKRRRYPMADGAHR